MQLAKELANILEFLKTTNSILEQPAKKIEKEKVKHSVLLSIEWYNLKFKRKSQESLLRNLQIFSKR